MTNNGLAYKLLAIDLDGTLLDSSHRVPPRNRDALHRAHRAGLKIVLCTGRSYTETSPILLEIGLDLDAAVAAFGAIIVDVPTGQTLDRSPIPLALAREATAWFQQREYAVLWLLDRAEAGFDGYAIDGARRHPAVDRWLELTPCDVRCVDRLPGETFAPVRISIIDESAALRTMSREMNQAFEGRLIHNLLRAPSYDLTVLEAFAPRANKWHGIETLCRRWDIDPRRTAAVGDDVNDVQMIQKAGLGVAMANAQPVLKEAARHVTASNNDECGVAELVERLLEEKT